MSPLRSWNLRARENAGATTARSSVTTRLHRTPPATTCPVALAMELWKRDTLEPLAEDIFGSSVAQVEHLGAYSCRRLYGRDEGPWSEHATANAIDIAGFVLEDGTRISVLTRLERCRRQVAVPEGRARWRLRCILDRPVAGLQCGARRPFPLRHGRPLDRRLPLINSLRASIPRSAPCGSGPSHCPAATPCAGDEYAHRPSAVRYRSPCPTPRRAAGCG